MYVFQTHTVLMHVLGHIFSKLCRSIFCHISLHVFDPGLGRFGSSSSFFVSVIKMYQIIG